MTQVEDDGPMVGERWSLTGRLYKGQVYKGQAFDQGYMRPYHILFYTHRRCNSMNKPKPNLEALSHSLPYNTQPVTGAY
jgi:hypothetical protein